MCVPMSSFENPSKEDVKAIHVKDPELLERCEVFKETQAFGDLRFDSGRRLFFKGPYPNRCIPILSYDEISGYRIVIDGDPVAFDSIDGQRSIFRNCTDEYIRNASRKADEIMLEVDSSRPNVKVRPYPIRTFRHRIADSREDCFRAAVSISFLLDSIIEDNIIRLRNSNN